ncbi:MAG: 16S rRNA (guanine(527)-N(7))-methyltransferase RsmG [Gammaproteobacteria bacterium]
MTKTDTTTMPLYLQQTLLENGYQLSSETQQQLFAFLELMHKWNRVFNLTAIRDFKESILLHILDSLSVAKYLHGENIIDVGSGAGLPGIPLALMYPDKTFVLLDSNNKKTRFLTQAVFELKIKNVSVEHARVEDFKPIKTFDSIITRAFANIKVMLETTQHLLAEDGQFLAMKGVYPEAELKDIPAQFNVLAVHKLIIKGLLAERHLVCVKRI